MKLGHRRGILVAAFWAVNATACGSTFVPPSKLGPARQDASWPAYLGTPRHDACAAESLNTDPRPLWRTDVGRAVRGSPAIGETIIVAGAADRIVALVDRATGQALWRTRVAGTIHGGPLLEGDRLYVATEATPDARVYALRLRDGHSLWDTKTESISAPLALDGDTLYAGTETGLVLRLETSGGKITWRRRLPGAIRAPPVPTAAGIAVATTADTLYLLDRGTGQVRARLPTPGTVLGGPALVTVEVRQAGGIVAMVFQGTLEAGPYSVVWDGRAPTGPAPAGSYEVVVRAADELGESSQSASFELAPG